MRLQTFILIGCLALTFGCKEPSQGTAKKANDGTAAANQDSPSNTGKDPDSNPEKLKLLAIETFIKKQEKDKGMLVYPGSAYKDLQVTHDPAQDAVTMTFHLADDSKFNLPNGEVAKENLLPTYQKDRTLMNVIGNNTTLVNRVLKSDGSELFKFDFKKSDFPNYRF